MHASSLGRKPDQVRPVRATGAPRPSRGRVFERASARPDEAVVGRSLVVLLDAQGAQRGGGGGRKRPGEQIGPPGDLVQAGGELEREAQRVDLVLAFPDQRVGGPRPPSVAPVTPAGFRVHLEGVRIGVVGDQLVLPPHHPDQDVSQRTVRLRGDQGQVRPHLGAGIPQPHRRDVTGDHGDPLAAKPDQAAADRPGQALAEHRWHRRARQRIARPGLPVVQCPVGQQGRAPVLKPARVVDHGLSA